MRLTNNSTKLILEVNRLKTEYNKEICSVPMLISALFAIRGDEDFTNLFNAYFEKKLEIKMQVIDKVIEKLIETDGNTKSEKESEETSKKEYAFEARFDKFSECTDKKITVFADEELAAVIDSIETMIAECGKEKVICDYFSVALFETNSKSMRAFLKGISVNYMEAEMFFKRKNILDYEIVPYEISSFVKYINPDYVGKECFIMGREKELTEIYRNMLKFEKKSVIVYGSPGVGKSSIGILLTHNIANNLCPETFTNFKIFEMSVTKFITTTKDVNGANEKLNYLMSFLSRRSDDIILLIDEIQTILGKGGLFDSKKLDVSQTLKPILERGDVRILGITPFIDYISFTSDAALERRFYGVEAKEPKMKEVPKMITPKVRQIEKEQDVVFSDELIDSAIWYAACFDFNRCNPDKSMDVVDGAIANAKLHNRRIVTEKDVMDVFRVSYKRWDGMTAECKRNTAYHEAGHYVLNRLTNPGNFVVLAVSIYPTDEYGGVNVLEYDESITPTGNKAYYYNEIAADLAGRVAEKMVSGEITSGASADLDNATETAQSLVADFGMSDGIGKNRAYLSEGFGNDESAREVDEEVSKIIDEAYALCENILEENRDYLDAIAQALLEKHIMKKEELDAVWSDVEAARHSKPKTTVNTKKARSNKKFASVKADVAKKSKKFLKKALRTIEKKIK